LSGIWRNRTQSPTTCSFALAELLQAQRDYRWEIVDGIADGLQREAVEKFTTETVGEIDILATHHTVDWVGIDERHVVGITATHVEYEITGSVGVTLLYGSGGDRRRGDGPEIGEEFPIAMGFRVPVETPQDLGEAEITSEIDTAAWFGEDDDDSGEDGCQDIGGSEPVADSAPGLPFTSASGHICAGRHLARAPGTARPAADDRPPECCGSR